MFPSKTRSQLSLVAKPIIVHSARRRLSFSRITGLKNGKYKIYVRQIVRRRAKSIFFFSVTMRTHTFQVSRSATNYLAVRERLLNL